LCPAIDVIAAFDVNVALDTLLSVERVTIDRSLSLLTNVLIWARPLVAVTVVDFRKAFSTSLLLKMLNKNQRHVPAIRASKMKPSTHCVLALLRIQEVQAKIHHQRDTACD